MSASSYIILKEIGGVIIWIFKGFKVSYLSCRKNKYASEIGFLTVVIIVLVLFLTKW